MQLPLHHGRWTHLSQQQHCLMLPWFMLQLSSQALQLLQQRGQHIALRLPAAAPEALRRAGICERP